MGIVVWLVFQLIFRQKTNRWIHSCHYIWNSISYNKKTRFLFVSELDGHLRGIYVSILDSIWNITRLGCLLGTLCVDGLRSHGFSVIVTQLRVVWSAYSVWNHGSSPCLVSGALFGFIVVCLLLRRLHWPCLVSIHIHDTQRFVTRVISVSGLDTLAVDRSWQRTQHHFSYVEWPVKPHP